MLTFVLLLATLGPVFAETISHEFSPVITEEKPRLGQALSYDQYLGCRVQANPPPTISWMKDELLITSNNHYSIYNFALKDNFTNTTLQLKGVKKWQYGNYTCKAVNKLGQQEAHVVLFETNDPVCPPSCVQQRKLEKLAEN